MKKIIISLCLFFISTTAFSTSVSFSTKYFANLHFSNFYYTNKVESVMAHVGILLEGTHFFQERYNGYWQSVADINLTKKENGFAGKVILDGNDIHSSGGSVKGTGLIIQYFLTFADGRKEIVGPFLLSNKEAELSIEWQSLNYPSTEEAARKQYCKERLDFDKTPIEEIEETKLFLFVTAVTREDIPKCVL